VQCGFSSGKAASAAVALCTPEKKMLSAPAPLPGVVTTICLSVTQEQWLISANRLFSSTSGDSPRNISSILSGEGFDEM
jgi:hypothetical protein